MPSSTLLRHALRGLRPVSCSAVDGRAVLQHAPVAACCGNTASASTSSLHITWLPAPPAARQRSCLAAEDASQTPDVHRLQQPSSEPHATAANSGPGQGATGLSYLAHVQNRRQGAVIAVSSSTAHAGSMDRVAATTPTWQHCTDAHCAPQAHSRADFSRQQQSVQLTSQPWVPAAGQEQDALPRNAAGLRSTNGAFSKRCFATRPGPEPFPPPPLSPRGPGSGIDGVKHVIAVASGKGGVGKSTTAGVHCIAAAQRSLVNVVWIVSHHKVQL